ncbi:MAG TPA: helix-turn-helix domain-containing protein [Acidimicrobiia bacterium]|nr:helix-turn-helix domain-containing protein [Acidimicrobiia bacterium]
MTARVEDVVIDQADQQHLAWLSRSFGSSDYAPLNAQDLNALIAVAEVIAKYPAAHLFKEGDEAEAVFMVESGQVEVYWGRRSRQECDVSGTPGLGAGRHRRVRADYSHRIGPGGDPREGGPIRTGSVVDRVGPQSSDMPALAAGGDSPTRGHAEKVLHLMHTTVLGQVADLLGEEADGRGDVHLSQTTIATLLGVSRQSVNEALSRLRDQHAVETGYRHIRVLDPAKLARIAGS